MRYGPVSRQATEQQIHPAGEELLRPAGALSRQWRQRCCNLATALFLHFERCFTFLRCDGVEPTNNSAERALRRAVQWRKTSFGSRSAEGEMAVARLLTVTRTCGMQNRQPFDYLALADAVAVNRKAWPAPSLLKKTQTT